MSKREKRNILKDLLFPLWYSLISKLDRNAEVQFMNFGYTCPDLEIELGEHHEKNRYPIQLYHQIAMKEDLKGKRLVEVGCGRGGGLSYLYEKFSPVSAVGIDLSQEAIKFCRDHYGSPDLDFITANAEDLPFEDNSVDVLINVESSHRYANMDKFLSEVKRVLKLGGKFLITDFRNHEHMHHLKQSLTNSGLYQKTEEIITHKVLNALDLDDSRRRTLVRRILPGFLHNTGYDFAAVKGSRTYNKFADGKLVYFNYIMEKRHHSDL